MRQIEPTGVYRGPRWIESHGPPRTRSREQVPAGQRAILVLVIHEGPARVMPLTCGPRAAVRGAASSRRCLQASPGPQAGRAALAGAARRAPRLTPLARGPAARSLIQAQQQRHQQQRGTADGAAGTSAPVQVSFCLSRRVRFGERLILVGAHELLARSGGSPWDPAAGKALRWSEGDVWSVDVQLPPG